ncbi:glycosyltransferase family 4 protein [Sphingomonas sp. R86520]|uniref:glycosyltransferase family 4 protein n=1 Tax=Sphingomonas sp. R86520 TaxID=3093859 RepID=UPI0036D35343
MADVISPMTIVHVVRQYLPGIGGIENFVSLLATGQAQAGHRVRVVTLDRIFDGDNAPLPRRERYGGVDVVRVPFRGLKKYPFAPGMVRHVSDADIIHVHGIESSVDLLAVTQRWHRRPMVVSTHGGIFHTPRGGWLKRCWFATITRLSLKHYAAVIASSVQDAGTFTPIAGNKVVLVENAVDTEKFAGLGDPTATTVIYFGRLAPSKNVDRLLLWFAAVHKASPAWRLIIAGKEMGTKIAILRSLALRLGVASAVEFYAAPTDGRLAELIARCSVFACASRYEGFGIAAVEAAAAGLFPVLSTIPAFQRTFERLQTGMLCDFDADPDPAAFLERFAAARPSDRQALSAALASFAWPGVLADIEAAYVKACVDRGTAYASPPNNGSIRPETNKDIIHNSLIAVPSPGYRNLYQGEGTS